MLVAVVELVGPPSGGRPPRAAMRAGLLLLVAGQEVGEKKGWGTDQPAAPRGTPESARETRAQQEGARSP